MNKVKVTIHIVPSLDVSSLVSFDRNRDGKVMSSVNEIKVNLASDGYSVVYTAEAFEELSPSRFTASLIQLFAANVPNTIIEVSLMYHYETNDDYEFDTDTAKAVLDMDDVMIKITQSNKINTFIYERSDNVHDVYQDWRDELGDGDADSSDPDDDDDFDWDDSEYDDDAVDPDDPFAFLRGYGDDGKGSKKSKEYYGRSRVWRDAKNPKKAVHRHGVLIADSRSDLKKDEKIIKDFLKDFLPGSADWKKEFRNDVSKRWLSMYAISKKQLKQLEKQHRKTRAKKNRSGIDTDKALDFTRRLFSVPVDRWSDPTR